MPYPLISRKQFLKILATSGVILTLGGFGGFSSLLNNRKKGGGGSGNGSTSYSQLASARTTGGGSWSLGGNTAGPAIHAAVTATGKILYIAGSSYCVNNTAGPYIGRLRDPTTGSETTVNMTDDLFCCGSAQLPNGNILFCGGTKMYETDINNCAGKWQGGNFAYEFDMATGNMVKRTSMAHGRWYPTCVTLPNGRVVVVSGADEYGTYNYLTEIYDPNTKSR